MKRSCGRYLRMLAVCAAILCLSGNGVPGPGNLREGAPYAAAVSQTVTEGAGEERLLYPGGMLFGVRCSVSGVLVIGFENVNGHPCPAKAAGLRQGDLITAADGEPVTSVKSLADRISACGAEGKTVCLTVCRGGEALEFEVRPAVGEDGVCRAGLWTRDSAAGIGTVTFIDPETGLFGGLGHGICDADTGTLLPLARGTTLDVTVSEIVRGSAGTPGELRGFLGSRRTGSLTDNTPSGVFGVFSALPAQPLTGPVPVGRAEEIHEGKAEILCTLGEDGPASYAIEIVRPGKTGEQGGGAGSFVIEVTDAALLEKTGGIIQGMSGSPILQDGRLIGAVTHVLVNHPERGYGIPVETMLRTMEHGAFSLSAA